MKYFIYVLLWVGATASAQTVQNFKLSNAIDGKEVNLNSYSSHAGVVVIFTSNNCPFDQYYLDRIRLLANTYSSKVPVLLINSHTDKNESVEAMKNYARQCNLTIPYLADKDQSVMSQFLARKSPEALLLKNSSGKFSVVYRGAIDDNAQTASEVRDTYLKDAIDKMLAGQKIEVADVRPVGCSIRKN